MTLVLVFGAIKKSHMSYSLAFAREEMLTLLSPIAVQCSANNRLDSAYQLYAQPMQVSTCSNEIHSVKSSLYVADELE